MKVNVFIYESEKTPSCRLRWINYQKNFSEDKIEFNIMRKKDYFIKGFMKKLPSQCDIAILQKFPINIFALYLLKLKAKKVIFDIDDAIWLTHSNTGQKVNLIKKFYNLRLNKCLSRVDHIIVSNQFIANYVSKFNKNISIIPTSPTDEVNINKKREFFLEQDKFIVGWTGTKENLYYIKQIEPYIKDFFISNSDAFLVIISNDKYTSEVEEFNEKIININWTLENEAYYIDKFNIGIMPSSTDEWALGKAAYKLIYYMKRKIPTISTNWGYQTEFIINGKNGFLVSNNHEWIDIINQLYKDTIYSQSIAIEGYYTYEKYFEKNIIYKKYLKALK